MEWYQRPDREGLMPLLETIVKPGMQVLIVGCGNSALGEHLYEMAADVTNIDFSETVISQMEEKYGAKCEGMKWHCMNVREMNPQICPDSHFDVVIDKACLDCNLSGPGSARNADYFCAEVSRVLKSMGVFISLSFAKPDVR